jgi:hypothetical protein
VNTKTFSTSLLLLSLAAFAAATQPSENVGSILRPKSEWQRNADKQTWLSVSEEDRQAFLAGQIERLSLASAAAQFVRDGEHERALKLLEVALVGSAETSELLVSIGTQLPAPSAELTLGVERAQRYARRYDLSLAADQLALVEEKGFAGEDDNQ